MTDPRRRKHWLTVLACLSAAAGCVTVDEADSLVAEAQVLAIRATPAEAARRQEVELQALYVDASGTLQEGALDWAFCVQRKSLAELGPVDARCLAPEGEALEPLGAGLSATGTVPMDACRLFGPDRPPPEDGEPAGRPVDPDTTGGYYQPVRAYDAEQERYAIFELRVSCNLPGVTQAQLAEWNQRYVPNANPALQALEVRVGEDAEALVPDDPSVVHVVEPGETLSLRARWSDCPDEPVAEGCEGSETYLHFDLATRAFETRREAMRLSWFSTAGRFREPRTGRRGAAAADESSSDNAWTAPDDEREVTLWVVLRDERGGTAWQSFALRVER